MSSTIDSNSASLVDTFWAATRELIRQRHLFAMASGGAFRTVANNLHRTSLKADGLTHLRKTDLLSLEAERLELREMHRDALEVAEREWHELVASMPDKPGSPRVLRLARTYDYSPRLVELVCCLILLNVDPHILQLDARASHFELAVSEVLQFQGLNATDLVTLLKPIDSSSKQSWFRLEEGRYGAGLLARTFRIASTALLVLSDAPISDDEVRAMNPGVVRDLVLDELEHLESRRFLCATEVAESEAPLFSGTATGDEMALSAVPLLDAVADLSGLDLGRLAVSGGGGTDGRDSAMPFQDDQAYVGAWCTMVRSRIRSIESANRLLKDSELSSTLADESRRGRRNIEQRVAAARASGGWLPCAERLADHFGLDRYEVSVLMCLAAAGLDPSLQDSMLSLPRTVAWVLRVTCDSPEEMIARRRHFVGMAPLISRQLVRISSDYRHLLGCSVEIDRRLLSLLVAEEPAGAMMADGIELTEPLARKDDVVLDDATDKLISDVVRSQRDMARVVISSGLADVVRYGRTPVLLFWGPSGTGKTRKAHAVASEMGKRVLVASHARISREGLLASVRDAAICNAILLIDEAHEVFRALSPLGNLSGTMLTEIERFETTIVLCTTEPDQLMVPMLRRITLEVEFREPDVSQRERIWRMHLPTDLRLGPDVDLALLSDRHQIPGGAIKNSVMLAVSLAVARDADATVVTHADLEAGARLSSRTRIRLSGMADSRLATGTWNDLVVRPETLAALEKMVAVERARHAVAGEWGLRVGPHSSACMSAVFYGPPGTGKTLAAVEIVPGELGYPVRRVAASQVISMWVGQTARNLDALFGANHEQSVLVVSEAEALFGRRVGGGSATDRHANHDTATLLQQLERFRGVLILDTNRLEDFDEAFLRRIRYKVPFVKPGPTERERLLRTLVPTQMPVAADVDFGVLARIPFTGAEARNGIAQAAAEAWLRGEGERVVRQGDLEEALRAEVGGAGRDQTIGF